MQQEFDTNNDVEEIIAILDDYSPSSSLADAYELLINDEPYSEEPELQVSVFVVQQIYDVCNEYDGKSTPFLLKQVGKRIKQAASELSALIDQAFITNEQKQSKPVRHNPRS